MGLSTGEPDIDGGRVLLMGSGGTAPVLDLIDEHPEQVIHEKVVAGLEIPGFLRICAEVVKLKLGGLAGVVFPRAGETPTTRAGAEEKFPILFAIGERPVDGMADEILSRAAGFAEGSREKGITVFRGIVGNLEAEDIGEGGGEVGQRDELIGAGGSGDFSGPSNEEGDAMASLIDVGFMTSPMCGGQVAFAAKFVQLSQRRRAVVAGQAEESVVFESVAGECIENCADGAVALHDVVGVGIETTFSPPLIGGSSRRVRRREGEIEEEGLACAGSGGL